MGDKVILVVSLVVVVGGLWSLILDLSIWLFCFSSSPINLSASLSLRKEGKKETKILFNYNLILGFWWIFSSENVFPDQ